MFREQMNQAWRVSWPGKLYVIDVAAKRSSLVRLS